MPGERHYHHPKRQAGQPHFSHGRNAVMGKSCSKSSYSHLWAHRGGKKPLGTISMNLPRIKTASTT